MPFFGLGLPFSGLGMPSLPLGLPFLASDILCLVSAEIVLPFPASEIFCLCSVERGPSFVPATQPSSPFSLIRFAQSSDSTILLSLENDKANSDMIMESMNGSDTQMVTTCCLPCFLICRIQCLPEPLYLYGSLVVLPKYLSFVTECCLMYRTVGGII